MTDEKAKKVRAHIERTKALVIDRAGELIRKGWDPSSEEPLSPDAMAEYVTRELRREFGLDEVPLDDLQQQAVEKAFEDLLSDTRFGSG